MSRVSATVRSSTRLQDPASRSSRHRTASICRTICVIGTRPATRRWRGQWTQVVLPWALERARAVQPDVIISQDFTRPLATSLRDTLGAPYCLVHGSVYFGPDMLRPAQADYSRAEIELMLRRRADFAAIAPPDLTLIATDARFDRPPNPPPPECTGSARCCGSPRCRRPRFSEPMGIRGC